MALLKNIRIFEKNVPGSPYSFIMEHKGRAESVLFQSDFIATLNETETQNLLKDYSKIADAYACLGVLTVNTPKDETVHFLIVVTACMSVGKLPEFEVHKITRVSCLSLRNGPTDAQLVSEIQKLLMSEIFYFARSPDDRPYDLSVSVQTGHTRGRSEGDNRFFWNRSLHRLFNEFGVPAQDWLVFAICGGVEVKTIYCGERQAKACVISRLSAERAGTRFNVRGANDDGRVANFCETEQVIYLDDAATSLLQTRGSVPLFWEQPGLQIGSHRIRMSRGFEASGHAFRRHLRNMKSLYGSVAIVNLLGNKEGEGDLSKAYHGHYQDSRKLCSDVPYIAFDYHAECSGGNLSRLGDLLARLRPYLAQCGFFVRDSEHQELQTGVIRTNCVDCLDRTNAVQTVIGVETVLPAQLASLLGSAPTEQLCKRFSDAFREMWLQNGDSVSRIYAGTGALGGGRSKIKDAARSGSRTIQNNFLDSSKQEAMDVLIYNSTLRGDLAARSSALLPKSFLHLPPQELRALLAAHEEYTDVFPARVLVGTWNVNGGKHFRSLAHKDASLADWLINLPEISRATAPKCIHAGADFTQPPDFYAIGFQELVDLNASNIVNASSTNRRLWQKELLNTLLQGGSQRYILLTSVQLVGVCLYVFVRAGLAKHVREVGTASVKTGMKGTAGNKGGVAIRLVYHNTSLAFVCSHFAAGQSNFKERNADFQQIYQRLTFQMGRSLAQHDYIFWCGDFNYRVNMGRDQVIRCVEEQNWDELRRHDQLSDQRRQGLVFPNFHEGHTGFPPTYKYDLFSDEFDSSEKCRVPAYTDRVLWTRNSPVQLGGPGKLLMYNMAPLKISDHRPVACLLEIEVSRTNRARRNAVYESHAASAGPPDATVVVRVTDTDYFDDASLEFLIGLFGRCGQALLVRLKSDTVLFTYADGASALRAIQELNGTQLDDGRLVLASLRLPDWRERAMAEVDDLVGATCSHDGESNEELDDDAGSDLERHQEDDGGVGDDDDEIADAEDVALAGTSLYLPVAGGASQQSLKQSRSASDLLRLGPGCAGGSSTNLAAAAAADTQHQRSPSPQPPPLPPPPMRPPPPKSPARTPTAAAATPPPLPPLPKRPPPPPASFTIGTTADESPDLSPSPAMVSPQQPLLPPPPASLLASVGAAPMPPQQQHRLPGPGPPQHQAPRPSFGPRGVGPPPRPMGPAVAPPPFAVGPPRGPPPPPFPGGGGGPRPPPPQGDPRMTAMMRPRPPPPHPQHPQQQPPPPHPAHPQQPLAHRFPGPPPQLPPRPPASAAPVVDPFGADPWSSALGSASTLATPSVGHRPRSPSPSSRKQLPEPPAAWSPIVLDDADLPPPAPPARQPAVALSSAAWETSPWDQADGGPTEAESAELDAAFGHVFRDGGLVVAPPEPRPVTPTSTMATAVSPLPPSVPPPPLPPRQLND